MSISEHINRILHTKGLHITRHSDPGKLPWILKNLNSAPSPLSWMAPEIIRQHGLKTFVQVGANDGELGDPLKNCIKEFELRGIMVEPQPVQCAVLKEKYAGTDRVIVDQVAVSSTAGSLSLFYLEARAEAGLPTKFNRPDIFTSSVRTHMMHAQEALGYPADIKEMKVPAMTWTGLLSKHNLPDPDIVVVDTEGMDDVIVNQIVLTGPQPTIIQFEHMHLDSSRLEACTERLFEAGYRFIISEYDVLCLHQKVWKA